MTLAIINTQCANLASLKFAIDRLGYECIVSNDINVLQKADKLFLPGVGTAQKAMQSLKKLNLINFLQNTNKPLLGICLGMQLLGKYSKELDQNTLACIDFDTIKFKNDLVIPHMGWNKVNSDNELFKGLNGAYFYFVHSYFVELNEYSIASCDYGISFSAGVKYNNFYGVQFHPEKSSEAGEYLLKNFITL